MKESKNDHKNGCGERKTPVMRLMVELGVFQTSAENWQFKRQ